MCWRKDLQRKITPYVHGYLSPDSRKEIESHLTECDRCRIVLSRILVANRLAGHLPSVSAPIDSWKAIESTIGKKSRSSTNALPFPMKTILGAAATVFTVFLFFLLWTGFPDFQKQDSFDPAAFRPVSISQFPNTVEPHVATEGYVTQISVQDEEGDLKFKLVDNLHRPNHFVVCEIIAPFKMTAPSPGSRIRVYGVSRYDSKADHQWFEVHPVLNIEPVR
jgi:Putative zinc-finger